MELLTRGETTTNTYNDDGLVLFSIYEIDRDGDGVIDEGETTTNTYNDDGLVLSSVKEVDKDADGVIDEISTTINTHNDDGLVLSSREEVDRDANGFLERFTDHVNVTTNTYNDLGLLLSSDFSTSGAIPFSFFSINNTYSDEGLLLSSVEIQGDESKPSSSFTTTNTYSDEGLLLSSVSVEEFDWYYEVYVTVGRGTTIYNYNDEGLLISSVEEVDIDSDIDGVIDKRETTTNTYNNEGLVLSSVEEVNTEVDSIIDDPDYLVPTIELFRFRNTTFETGAYVFVGAEERDAILADENLSNTFSLDGLQEDGTVNPAFEASLKPRDGLTDFYRLKSLDVPGTFLFVSRGILGGGEYDLIFADDSDQRDKWEPEGFDENGEDIPEFYVRYSSADRGVTFNRFQNTQNNTFLYAGPAETEAIENDPNLSGLFNNQGVDFNSW